MATKKTTKSRQLKKSVTPDNMRSFRVYPGEKPFLKPRISHQTFYWLVIALLVLALGIWATFLSIKIQAIYDRVDVISAAGKD